MDTALAAQPFFFVLVHGEAVGQKPGKWHFFFFIRSPLFIIHCLAPRPASNFCLEIRRENML